MGRNFVSGQTDFASHTQITFLVFTQESQGRVLRDQLWQAAPPARGQGLAVGEGQTLEGAPKPHL